MACFLPVVCKLAAQPFPETNNSTSFVAVEKIEVEVTNPGNFRRDDETVELNLREIAPRLRLNPAVAQLAVVDKTSLRVLDSQTYASEVGEVPDKLLFQVSLGPNETRSYYVMSASALGATPRPIVKTFARYVPERFDDFAWESDRIAFRMYGQGLIHAQNLSLTSSGVDVWVKATRQLTINQLYALRDYHKGNGIAMDDYAVGASRGDGGLGIWDGKRLYVSSNYQHFRLITSGPIRSEFELTYDDWLVGPTRKVSEIKRISIDASSYFSKAQSIFDSDDSSPLTVGIGLAERPCGTNGSELISQDPDEGWMTYWQPPDGAKGNIGVAIILPRDSVREFTNDTPDLSYPKIHAMVSSATIEGAPPIRNLLAVTQAQVNKPLTYYFGACWSRSGDFTNDVQWKDYVRQFAQRRDVPLKVVLQRNEKK